MYIVFPFVLPAVGIARGVGPFIGVVIGILAIVSITYSIRRFWRANHSKRWHYTIFGLDHHRLPDLPRLQGHRRHHLSRTRCRS